MCSTENEILINKCVTELRRTTRTTLAKLKNDTVAYFNNQVNSHWILCSRKYEVSDQACKFLSVTLHQTNYYVKTVLGVLDTSYCSTQEYALYESR